MVESLSSLELELRSNLVSLSAQLQLLEQIDVAHPDIEQAKLDLRSVINLSRESLLNLRKASLLQQIDQASSILPAPPLTLKPSVQTPVSAIECITSAIPDVPVLHSFCYHYPPEPVDSNPDTNECNSANSSSLKHVTTSSSVYYDQSHAGADDVEEFDDAMDESSESDQEEEVVVKPVIVPFKPSAAAAGFIRINFQRASLSGFSLGVEPICNARHKTQAVSGDFAAWERFNGSKFGSDYLSRYGHIRGRGLGPSLLGVPEPVCLEAVVFKRHRALDFIDKDRRTASLDRQRRDGAACFSNVSKKDHNTDSVANQRGTDDLFAFVNRTINRTQGVSCVNPSNLVDPCSTVHNRSTTNTNIVIDPNLLQANCLSKIADTEHRMVDLRSAIGLYRNDRVTMSRLQDEMNTLTQRLAQLQEASRRIQQTLHRKRHHAKMNNAAKLF